MKILILESINLAKDIFTSCSDHSLDIFLLKGEGHKLRTSKLSESFLKKFKVTVIESPWDIKNNLEILTEHGPYDGMISLNDFDIEFAAELANKFQIPFTNLQAIKNCKNKLKLRDMLRANGLSRCRSVNISEINLTNQIESFGFPCVLKPKNSSASLNVHIFQNISDVSKNLKKIESVIDSSEFILEDFLKGPLISVELCAYNGEYTVLSVGYRFRSLENEAIEIGTLMPAPLPDNIAKKCSILSVKAAETAGLDLGIFHIEIIVTKDIPEIVEINPRLMGGSLPSLYSRVYSTNIFDLLVRAQMRINDFKINSEPTTCGISCFFGALNHSVFPHNIDVSWADKFRKYNFLIEWFYKPGDQITALTGNLNYVGKFLLFSETSQDCIELRNQVLMSIRQSLGFDISSPEEVIIFE